MTDPEQPNPAGAIICWAKCEACQYGGCYDEPTTHSWMEPEDLEHARATGQDIPDPLPRCGCWCTGYWPGSEQQLTADEFARMSANTREFWETDVEAGDG